MKRCRMCKERAIIYMPHHRLALCRTHFTEWFERYTQKTIKEFRMFTKNDRVLVAVSGGKDSLALWYVLKKLGYEADGLYVHLGIGEYSERSRKKVESFARKIGARLIVKDLKEDLAEIPELMKVSTREACSLCGLVKRYNFNRVAKEEGYTVLATGHNLDDEASSLLANVLNWNEKYLGRKYPVLEEEEGFVRKVKPFCKFTEKETALYSLLQGIDFIEEECPYAEDATSIFMKGILNEIEERFPGTKLRFYLDYLRKVYPLFHKPQEKKELKPCRVCGEPTAGEICPVCRMRERLKETSVDKSLKES
ncbi:MAG: TIGR00269 family protein [Aquificae bacterium]|nr:TIGR00269 family protein [Aquificota bacterium]